MCLGETASLIITWPYDRPKVADFFFPKKRKKKKNNNFYQLAQWCKCKIMSWDDCKHADFQMFDKTVQKYQQGRLTVSVINSAGILAFFFYLVKWFRREKNWRFVYHLSNSNPAIMRKENFVSENTKKWANLLLLFSEIGTAWFA